MKKSILVAPCNGEVIELSSVNDEVFSSGMLGNGFAIIPEGNDFVCPCDGEIQEAHEARHAYTIVSNDGIEILVHIGIDTIELDGDGFTSFVNNGDTVLQGGKLASVDIQMVIENEYDPVAIIILTNDYMLGDYKINYGKIKAGDAVVEYNL